MFGRLDGEEDSMLDDSEQRRLDDIARLLITDDPGFAARMGRSPRRWRRYMPRIVRCCYTIVIALSLMSAMVCLALPGSAPAATPALFLALTAFLRRWSRNDGFTM